MFSWLADKTIIGAISRDICSKYLKIKDLHPIEDESKIIERVFNYYLTLNEEAIRTEDELEKILRLDLIKDKYFSLTKVEKSVYTLFDLYRDILYIEAELDMHDGKPYRTALNIFIKNAKGLGLNYEGEYDRHFELLKKIGAL